MDEVETFQATKVDCICAQKYKKWSLGGGRGGIITVESKKIGKEWWLFWEVETTPQFLFFFSQNLAGDPEKILWSRIDIHTTNPHGQTIIFTD